MSTAPGLGAPPQGSFWARRCVPPGPGTPGTHPVTAAGSTSGCNSHSFILKYSWGTLSGNENKMLSSTKGGEGRRDHLRLSESMTTELNPPNVTLHFSSATRIGIHQLKQRNNQFRPRALPRTTEGSAERPGELSAQLQCCGQSVRAGLGRGLALTRHSRGRALWHFTGSSWSAKRRESSLPSRCRRRES